MKIRKLLLKNKDVTLISNNCFAGMFYKRYGLKFNSPTAGLFIKAFDYIKFLENLPLIIKGEFVLNEKLGTSEKWPVGELIVENTSIIIHFMHYKTFEDAIEKWLRRTKRINLNNMVIILMHTPILSKEVVKQFERLPYSNKVFVYDKDKIDELGILKTTKCFSTNAFHWQPEFSWDYSMIEKDTNMRRIVNSIK